MMGLGEDFIGARLPIKTKDARCGPRWLDSAVVPRERHLTGT